MYGDYDAYSKARIGRIDHNGKFKAMSVHNSFLDLAIIGGIGFSLIYLIAAFHRYCPPSQH